MNLKRQLLNLSIWFHQHFIYPPILLYSDMEHKLSSSTSNLSSFSLWRDQHLFWSNINISFHWPFLNADISTSTISHVVSHALKEFHSKIPKVSNIFHKNFTKNPRFTPTEQIWFYLGCWCAETIVIPFIKGSLQHPPQQHPCTLGQGLSVCEQHWHIWTHGVKTLLQEWSNAVPSFQYYKTFLHQRKPKNHPQSNTLVI